ncbi:MAG: hypothetical protein EOS36_30420 [Mesorhizobium sp.]|uniref:hypothetical protein n=1 Tax=Mesorhizobium sp. TaxID=1871066 RepID=UPI000FE55A2F|nr:hypothetical protein [Mesorhizobium sp.]RWD50455.1 MAG: hypothetical protein EOS36_30420 [Mesorhizobium sp.]RWE39598.1 MAG: hypothetical protein EOS79_20455 [Mesorhizobium sp.]
MSATDARLKGFREGWAAKTPGKAHYFRRFEAGGARSLCGAQDGPAGYLIDAGSSTRCKRCETLAAQLAKDVPRP